MDSVSFVDKSFTKDLSYIDYNVSKNFFLKSQKNSTFLLDFSTQILYIIFRNILFYNCVEQLLRLFYAIFFIFNREYATGAVENPAAVNREKSRPYKFQP